MSYLLSLFCCLLLTNMSGALLVSQFPRFLGLHPGRLVELWCLLPDQISVANSSVRWFRLDKFDDPLLEEKEKEVTAGARVSMWTENQNKSILNIKMLQAEDSGVYFCRMGQIWGPGTELRVARSVSWELRSYRSQVKDGLIILQGLLLAGCVTALLLRKRTLLEESDSVYEEPEIDHIYEGLTIETCGGGGLYEELSLYTQPQTTEAPWQ